MMTLEVTIVTEQFFNQPMRVIDPAVHKAVVAEEARQREQLELIAPKNYMSRAVREAHDSILAFTSVEGYPGRRWHAGVGNIDTIERLCIERARALYKCRYSNIQPHSGTQANQAVFFALLHPGDRVLSMALDAGGHLSHGLAGNMSGRWFAISNYGVREHDGLIDYDRVLSSALDTRPKLIICGGSSYPRAIDFARMRAIADQVGAWLMADIAHVAGLVAAGAYPSPFPHCHVVTATTNKNLRGPRGGLLLSDDPDLGPRLDRAVFPGIQGGPLPEYTVAKTVMFAETLRPEFHEWAHAVLGNARVLAASLSRRGYPIVTGGTDTPLVIADLRSRGLAGNTASAALESAGMPCNKNLVPGDPEPPTVTSGLRFGTSAVTTRGLRDREMARLGDLVGTVLDELPDPNPATIRRVRHEVHQIARMFPIYRPSAEEAVA